MDPVRGNKDHLLTRFATVMLLILILWIMIPVKDLCSTQPEVQDLVRWKTICHNFLLGVPESYDGIQEEIEGEDV